MKVRNSPGQFLRENHDYSGAHHPLISPVNKLGLRHPRKGDLERK